MERESTLFSSTLRSLQVQLHSPLLQKYKSFFNIVLFFDSVIFSDVILGIAKEHDFANRAVNQRCNIEVFLGRFPK